MPDHSFSRAGPPTPRIPICLPSTSWQSCRQKRQTQILGVPRHRLLLPAHAAGRHLVEPNHVELDVPHDRKVYRGVSGSRPRMVFVEHHVKRPVRCAEERSSKGRLRSNGETARKGPRRFSTSQCCTATRSAFFGSTVSDDSTASYQRSAASVKGRFHPHSAGCWTLVADSRQRGKSHFGASTLGQYSVSQYRWRGFDRPRHLSI